MRPDEPCVHEREATGPLGRFFFVNGLPCSECAAGAHAAWIEQVRAKLAAGLDAAGRGERYDWDAPEPDGPPFALVRLDDRIDLALTVGDDGRCTVPVAGRYTLGRVTALQDAIDAERGQRILKRIREGVMTLSQVRQAYGREDPLLFPSGVGEILRGILCPEPAPGPPWVHTSAPPRCDLDDCCETGEPCGCGCHRPQPTHTITFDTSGAADA